MNIRVSMLLATIAIQSFCQTTFAKNHYTSILSMKDRAEVIDQVTDSRVKTLLPAMMKQSNIDMWLMISREYNEDPVLKTFLPATWISARRTTILALILTEDGEVKSFAIAPYKVGNLFERAWDKKK